MPYDVSTELHIKGPVRLPSLGLPGLGVQTALRAVVSSTHSCMHSNSHSEVKTFLLPLGSSHSGVLILRLSGDHVLFCPMEQAWLGSRWALRPYLVWKSWWNFVCLSSLAVIGYPHLMKEESTNWVCGTSSHSQGQGTQQLSWLLYKSQTRDCCGKQGTRLCQMS